MESNDKEELSRMFYELLVNNGVLFQYMKYCDLVWVMRATHETSWIARVHGMDTKEGENFWKAINLLWHRKLDLYYENKQLRK